MTVLFIGVGFFPWLTSGEKNYFLRLFPLLQQEIDVAVLSLNDYSEDHLSLETPDGPIPVYCARRPFHRNYEQFFHQANGYTAYHHRHKPAQEILEKFVAAAWFTPKIRQIIRRHQVKVIHFMDNFGPAMPVLKGLMPRNIKVTYSAANYDPRGSQAQYDRYLRLSLGRLDGLGVYTHAYAEKLHRLGIRTPQFLTPWGVPYGNQALSPAKKQEIRRQLDLEDGQILVLWSGYLQQIQETDFYKTVEVARQVVRKRPDITFVFAFKPETYKTEYGAAAGDRIRVLTGLRQFGQVLETADVFLSPIGNRRSTVSPPLTWLEALALGTPVVSTRIGGVDEVITHGQTGLVAEGYPDLPDLLIREIDREQLIHMGEESRSLIRERYTIQHAARAALTMWRQVVDQPEHLTKENQGV